MAVRKRNWYKWLVIVFSLAVLWELFIFVRLPKQAFIQGLFESWFVSNGLVFYRDFFGAYLPFLRLLMIPLHEIFGYNQYTTIVLAPITSISVLLILFLASRKWLTGWFGLVPIIFFSVWHTFLPNNNHFVASTFLGVNVLISLILWLLWWNKPTKSKSFLVGLFTAFGVFSVQIVLPFYVILNATFFLKFRGRIKESLNHLRASLFGFLIPTLVIFLWFLEKGALYDLYVWTIKYHFTNYPYASFGRGTEDVLIYLSIHLPIIVFLAANLKKIKEVAIFFMYISLPLVFWFAMFGPTRFEISLPSFALIFGLAVQSMFKNESTKLQRFCFVILALVLLVNFYTITKYKLVTYKEKLFETNYTHQIISKIYPDDPMYNAVEWMKVNSNPEDKIFVLGDVLFYVESERLPANKAIASEPFAFVSFEEFRTEIENSWPSYWAIDERLWKRFDDFGYSELRISFQKLIEKDPVVARFDYWTIRKH